MPCDRPLAFLVIVGESVVTPADVGGITTEKAPSPLNPKRLPAADGSRPLAASKSGGKIESENGARGVGVTAPWAWAKWSQLSPTA